MSFISLETSFFFYFLQQAILLCLSNISICTFYFFSISGWNLCIHSCTHVYVQPNRNALIFQISLQLHRHDSDAGYEQIPGIPPQKHRPLAEAEEQQDYRQLATICRRKLKLMPVHLLRELNPAAKLEQVIKTSKT